MAKLIDLTGCKFGKLTVIKKVESDNHGNRIWKCKCECGNFISVNTRDLRNGHTKSCGCLRRQSDTKSVFCDLTGKRFGRLTVIERAGSDKHKRALWKCRCDCGNFLFVITSRLKSGHTNSCGCYGKEMRLKATKIHGGSGERLFNIWNGIKSRCYNKNDTSYHNYGARGIFVCDEWKNDYSKFREWSLKNGYEDNLSIDRIENDGNYEPSNCRWVTTKIQNNNNRRNRIVEINGEIHTIAEWSEIKGVNESTLRGRIRSGIDKKHLFDHPNSIPRKAKIRITYNGETHTLSEWAKITGINERTLRGRYKNGDSIDRLFDSPHQGNKY